MSILCKKHSSRLDISMPLRFQFTTGNKNQIRQGVTRNVSAQGLYFVTKGRLTAGQQIRVLLELSSELTGKSPVACLYWGKVMHVKLTSSGGEDYGIGLSFIAYSNVNSRSTDPWVAPIRKLTRDECSERHPESSIA